MVFTCYGSLLKQFYSGTVKFGRFLTKIGYFGDFWDSRGPENFFHEKILEVIVDLGCMSYFLLIKRRSGSLLNCFYPLLSHFSQIWPFWVLRVLGARGSWVYGYFRAQTRLPTWKVSCKSPTKLRVKRSEPSLHTYPQECFFPIYERIA